MKPIPTVCVAALLSVAGTYLLFAQPVQSPAAALSEDRRRYQILSAGHGDTFILRDTHTGHCWERISAPYHEWLD